MAIRTLLIANRGEIAARVARTARAMGIATVALHSDPDAGAPHVLACDRAVRLPGRSPAETYLDVDAVLAAARATRADAVHPGYGFLSENAGFARACAAAGITFVGPSPEAIEAMGSKVAAKALMAAAGVPVLPGATLAGGDDDAAAVAAAGREVGYPLLVKAAFGGGGRGMRVVEDEAGLLDAVASAQREAASAFGDGTVFLERLVRSPRHIEIQVLGDTHGNVVSLFERECSIQRRYQKVVEEAPSPFVTPELRAALGEAAVKAATALDYVGAGTVEFVMGPDGDFAFLEVNTRLQVEHPVTEEITGLDLVRLQLLVAQGDPLPPEVRDATISGHAIEARLYAEDVAGGFLPASGRLARFAVPSGEGVRVDAGYTDGSVVGTDYDAMLAKVIAWAPTRAEAVRKLAATLRASRIHGVTTNRDLLVGVVEHPEFAAGATDTGFLVRHEPAALAAAASSPGTAAAHAVAAAAALQARRRAEAPVLATLPSGWRNVPTQPQVSSLRDVATDQVHDVRYRVDRRGRVVLAGEAAGVEVVEAGPAAVVLEVAGVEVRVEVHEADGRVFVDSPLGASTFEPVERFPLPGAVAAAGSLRAPMPGTVVRVLVAAGDHVAAGATLLVLEAMKMEHEVRAPVDGIVAELLVAAGDQVDNGAVLAVVEEG